MYSTELKILGERIRKQRRYMNYTQDDLAAIIEGSREHISKIERGEKDVQYSTLHKIVEALNMDANQLFSITKN